MTIKYEWGNNIPPIPIFSPNFQQLNGQLRVARRIVSSIDQKEDAKKNEEHVASAQDYRPKNIDSELSEVCAWSCWKPIWFRRFGLVSRTCFIWRWIVIGYRHLAESKVGDEKRIAAEDATLSLDLEGSSGIVCICFYLKGYFITLLLFKNIIFI